MYYFLLRISLIFHTIVAGNTGSSYGKHYDPHSDVSFTRVSGSFDYSSFVTDGTAPDRLTIGLLVVGTTGDLNPFISLGMKLVEEGHRVRLASHAQYKDKVLNHGLEFYPLAGDPKLLSEYMVKSKGKIIPSNWKIIREMKHMVPVVESILRSTWPAMTFPDPDTGKPFLPDAIISNPVTYGHIHIAEKLQIPVHFSFPQPWTATKAYAHPLMGSTYSNDWSKWNRVTYSLAESFEWIGTKVMINRFRKSLGLRKMKKKDYKRIRHLPFTFTYSPHLIPKPTDWGDNVDVVGTLRLPEDTVTPKFKPDTDLARFLAKGDPPIFVGFGSMVMNNPAAFRKMIVDAAVQSKQRVLLQSGWTDFSQGLALPDNVYVMGRAPHSWVFEQCSAVVHHGGAGTTAAGLYAAKPTFIVPFFGDQFFWGQAVYRAGVGVQPVAITDISATAFANAFKQLQSIQLQQKAETLAAFMQDEDGPSAAVDSFYRNLPPWKRVEVQGKERVQWYGSSHIASPNLDIV